MFPLFCYYDKIKEIHTVLFLLLISTMTKCWYDFYVELDMEKLVEGIDSQLEYSILHLRKNKYNDEWFNN